MSEMKRWFYRGWECVEVDAGELIANGRATTRRAKTATELHDLIDEEEKKHREEREA